MKATLRLALILALGTLAKVNPVFAGDFPFFNCLTDEIDLREFAAYRDQQSPTGYTLWFRTNLQSQSMPVGVVEQGDVWEINGILRTNPLVEMRFGAVVPVVCTGHCLGRADFRRTPAGSPIVLPPIQTPARCSIRL